MRAVEFNRDQEAETDSFLHECVCVYFFEFIEITKNLYENQTKKSPRLVLKVHHERKHAVLYNAQELSETLKFACGHHKLRSIAGREGGTADRGPTGRRIVGKSNPPRQRDSLPKHDVHRHNDHVDENKRHWEDKRTRVRVRVRVSDRV